MSAKSWKLATKAPSWELVEVRLFVPWSRMDGREPRASGLTSARGPKGRRIGRWGICARHNITRSCHFVKGVGLRVDFWRQMLYIGCRTFVVVYLKFCRTFVVSPYDGGVRNEVKETGEEKVLLAIRVPRSRAAA